MNSMSHQQRMMEIQHMSNACLVTLLPRVQESLQGAIKEGLVQNHMHFLAKTYFTMKTIIPVLIILLQREEGGQEALVCNLSHPLHQ